MPQSFTPGKTRYPLYKRLGGPQGRCGRTRKISPPPGFDPRTVHPVASRYTHYATRPTFHPRTVHPVASRYTHYATRPTFDPRTVQPVASRYTDYATRPSKWLLASRKMQSEFSAMIQYMQPSTGAEIHKPTAFAMRSLHHETETWSWCGGHYTVNISKYKFIAIRNYYINTRIT